MLGAALGFSMSYITLQFANSEHTDGIKQWQLKAFADGRVLKQNRSHLYASLGRISHSIGIKD